MPAPRGMRGKSRSAARIVLRIARRENKSGVKAKNRPSSCSPNERAHRWKILRGAAPAPKLTWAGWRLRSRRGATARLRSAPAAVKAATTTSAMPWRQSLFYRYSAGCALSCLSGGEAKRYRRKCPRNTGAGFGGEIARLTTCLAMVPCGMPAVSNARNNRPAIGAR